MIWVCLKIGYPKLCSKFEKVMIGKSVRGNHTLPNSVQEMCVCVSRPRWCAALRHENAKTASKRENAKTRKRENGQGSTKAQKRGSYIQISTGSKVPAWKFSGVKICNGTWWFPDLTAHVNAKQLHCYAIVVLICVALGPHGIQYRVAGCNRNILRYLSLFLALSISNLASLANLSNLSNNVF